MHLRHLFSIATLATLFASTGFPAPTNDTPAAAPVPATEIPSPFSPLSFADAQLAAARANKLIFVDFFTTWCGPCKTLDETTWRDPKVVQLLRDKSIALRIDAEKEPDLVKTYRVEAYPTLLVLNADGTERDRYTGYLDAGQFTDAFTKTIAGKTSLEQARETTKAAGPEDPRSRMQLARKLAEASQPAEAFAHYAWCYDHGTDAEPAFASQLYSTLPTAIGRLGKTYPAAREFLKDRRDPLQQNLLSDPKSANVDAVSRLAGLDLALKDDAAILAVLAALPEGRPRAAFGRLVFLRLVEKKHYKEAVSTASLEDEFKSSGEKISRALEIIKNSGQSLPPATIANMRMSTSFLGMTYAMALAGAGEAQRARTLADAVIAWNDTPEIRSKFSEGLREIGQNDLAAVYGPAPKKP